MSKWGVAARGGVTGGKAEKGLRGGGGSELAGIYTRGLVSGPGRRIERYWNSAWEEGRGGGATARLFLIFKI